MKMQSKMNMLAWRHYFLIISLKGNFLDAQGHLTPKGNGPIWLKFELVWDFMPVLVTCKFDKERIKTEGISVETSFSPI